MDSVNLLSKVEETGLIGVWTMRSDLSINDWLQYLSQSDGDINILCYAMHFLPEHPRFASIISEKLTNGVSVRILFGDPKGTYIKSRTDEERTEGSISSRIETSVQRIKAISNDIQIKYYDAPLYASIYTFGSKMLVSPHLYGVRGACAPLFMFQSTEEGLYASYFKYFEDVWKYEAKE